MWNFLVSWFLTLEFPRGGTQFCRISRGDSLFSLEFLKVKWQILKFQREDFGKVYPPPNFSGIIQWTGEFHPKSQITILVAQQLKLFQTNWKKIQTGGQVGARFPTGVDSMGSIPPIGSSKFDGGVGGGLDTVHGGSMGGLKCSWKIPVKEFICY